MNYLKDINFGRDLFSQDKIFLKLVLTQAVFGTFCIIKFHKLRHFNFIFVGKKIVVDTQPKLDVNKAFI